MHIMQKSVTYMGFVISASGISPTEEKVEAIKQAPGPENQALRAFLGMINYHGKFIRNLSFILQNSISFSKVTKNSSAPQVRGGIQKGQGLTLIIKCIGSL